MPRITSWPANVHPVSFDLISGPQAYGAEGQGSLTGLFQTVGSPYGLVAYTITLEPLRGAEEREYRGTLTALHGGANVVKMTFPDGARRESDYQSWAGGKQWAGGQQWGQQLAIVSVGANASEGDTQVTLANEHWGHDLGIGEVIGFSDYWGAHTITEILSAGTYRIWPALRNDITTAQKASLRPSIAVTVVAQSSGYSRQLANTGNLSITLREVRDDYVREHFLA